MNQKEESYDVVIIGAGLTGITLGHLLAKSNISFAIIEARPEIGGRISTVYPNINEPIEMGATWLGSKHKSLLNLLQQIGIDIFDQAIGETAIYEAISTSPHYLAKLPPNPDPSMRIKGGTMNLINTLKSTIDPSRIFLNDPVVKVKKNESSVFTDTNSNRFESKILVSTLPPNLLANTVEVSPPIPKNLLKIAQSTHTWMGESIKIALTFDKPFWRQNHLSGTVISNVGPIPEMYDHSNYKDNFYALKGFLNGGYFQLTKEERLSIVLNQLRKYYGNEIDTYTSYHERIWRKEKYTFTPYNEHVLPHQNNGHQIYSKPIHGDSIFIAGSETSPSHPGYMDGAVYSAQSIYNQIVSQIKT